MEFMLTVVGVVLLLSVTTLYMYLVEDDKVEPHVPTPMKHKGNFWDAETKKFYKWDELMELKKRGNKMTQYDESVEQQRQILELEKQAKRVVGIDTRYKDGLWYKQTVDYADGRRVTEYRDKRRATIEENRYGEDVD